MRITKQYDVDQLPKHCNKIVNHLYLCSAHVNCSVIVLWCWISVYSSMIEEEGFLLRLPQGIDVSNDSKTRNHPVIYCQRNSYLLHSSPFSSCMEKSMGQRSENIFVLEIIYKNTDWSKTPKSHSIYMFFSFKNWLILSFWWIVIIIIKSMLKLHFIVK